MNQETRSIYLDKVYLPVVDMVAAYGEELRTCENLLAMGYFKSCGVEIAKRAEWLEKEIARIEKLRKSRPQEGRRNDRHNHNRS